MFMLCRMAYNYQIFVTDSTYNLKIFLSIQS